MDQNSVQVIIDALKEEGIDLAVTLPEEPTYALTEAMRQDPFFQAVTVAGEGNGIAYCAGAALGGRRCVFVTGVAGLLVASWALSQMGMVYGAPILILASYRGDFGDHSGIPGSQLLMFKQVAEPLLSAFARALSYRQSKSEFETDDPRRQLRMPGLQPSHRSTVERRGALVKRFDCLKFLASLVGEHIFAVTSLSTNAPFWYNIRPQG